MKEPVNWNDLVTRCAKSPHLPAYESGGWGLSYGQLLTRARVLAAALEQLWPGEGPVLLYGHKQPALPVGMLACLLAGRAYVPCDESWPAARVEAVFRQAGASALLFADEAPAPWPEQLPAAPLWPMSEPGIIEPLAAPRPCDPEQTAYILFSSGSTGQPKGIPVPRRALANFARWLTARPGLALAPGETVVGQAAFSFDLSLADLTLAFCGQGRLVSLTRQELADPALLFQRLSASGAAVLVCTPTFLELCLCDKDFSPTLMPKLRAVFCCGEVLPRPAAEKFLARFPGASLLNAYGPTEAACAVCAVNAADALSTYSEGPLPVGLVEDAAVEIAALSPEGTVLSEGEAGELALRGESVFSGYLPGSGDARFSGGWYRTGDSGFVRDGHVWCTGRLDDQLKYCGWRIEPGEVEAALRTLPGVERAAVLPQRTPDGRVRRICAFLQAEESARLPDEEARRLLALRLPAYMLPGRFVWLDALPVTENGKCDRARLTREFLL
ncbi:MAG: AMP-binding protein [Fournierella sp.]|uniref:AMP-binding protein n=1 Tax=Allofournierella sp. TaxID=1940256 RepID=UPI002A815F01|nr:AMP-binding protein [Fournierella sp.]MDY4167293.1 AMP-binding protein [Fournierella sp.]